MLEDIVGDYKEKTVTLEDFPHFDAGLKMASVHPCRHASVMKVLLDRADAALKIRKGKLARVVAGQGHGGGGGRGADGEADVEGLVDTTSHLAISDSGHGRGSNSSINAGKRPGSSTAAFKEGVSVAGGSGGDEWEVLQHEHGGSSSGEGDGDGDEVAIRVDQYLVVFLKFMASVTPGIEHDFTMGV